MKVNRNSAADALLQELGVSEPGEIDLEAIAFHVNARVRQRKLAGCDACIVGHLNEAIITVNRECSLQRRRFSIAHELGHWHHHRGQRLACRADDITRDDNSFEREANNYAADLLMPWYLFKPIAKSIKRADFQEIKALAKLFSTSTTATAIRLLESAVFPVVLVCHRHDGRKWFKRAPTVPSTWFPKNQLDADSYALDVQFGDGSENVKFRKIKGSAWFDQSAARHWDVLESTIRTGSEETLSLLLLPDGMLK